MNTISATTNADLETSDTPNQIEQMKLDPSRDLSQTSSQAPDDDDVDSQSDIGVVVMSVMRKGLMNPGELDGNTKVSGTLIDGTERKRVTVETVAIDVGYVPGDPAVVVRSFAVDRHGQQRPLPYVMFIEPHLVDDYVKRILDIREEAAKHKDEKIPVAEMPPIDAEDVPDIDEEGPERREVDSFYVSSSVARVSKDHDYIEFIPRVKRGPDDDAALLKLLFKEEQIHGLAKILEVARDDPNRGRNDVVYAARLFEHDRNVTNSSDRDRPPQHHE